MIEATPLHLIEEPRFGELLLQSGALLNAKDKYGWTPLIRAVYNQNLEIVNFLIENGADLEAKNIHGYPAVCICENVYIMEPLILAGADVTIADRDRQTPFYKFFRLCREAKLLDHNFDINSFLPVLQRMLYSGGYVMTQINEENALHVSLAVASELGASPAFIWLLTNFKLLILLCAFRSVFGFGKNSHFHYLPKEIVCLIVQRLKTI